MAEHQTKPTAASVDNFINSLPEARRDTLELMQPVSVLSVHRCLRQLMLGRKTWRSLATTSISW